VAVAGLRVAEVILLLEEKALAHQELTHVMLLLPGLAPDAGPLKQFTDHAQGQLVVRLHEGQYLLEQGPGLVQVAVRTPRQLRDQAQ
jgi:hypothetical protein